MQTMATAITLSKKKTSLGNGVYVFIKKDKCPGIIRSAVESRKWEVETLSSQTGQPTGLKAHFKSQQLRLLKSDDDFPFLSSQVEENKDETEGMGDAKVEVQVQEAIIPAAQAPEIRVATVTEVEDNPIEVLLRSPSSSEEGTQPEEAKELETGSVDPQAATTMDDHDPDDVELEDFPYFPLDPGEDDTLNPNDAAASHGIELDEDKHKSKWARYLLEKSILVDDGWTVNCKAPKQDGLGVGCRVQEKSRQRHKGIIFFDDRAEFKLEGAPMWGVVYDGGTIQSANWKVPSSKLKRIKDTRVFK